MKKIISIIAIVAMLCMTISLSAFAATDAKILLTADNTSVKVGDTITVTVKITADTTANKGIAGTSKVVPTWDTAKFEFISAEAGANTLEYSNDPTVSTDYAADGKLTFTQKYTASADKASVAAKEFIFGTFKLKALEAGEFSISNFSGTGTSVVLNVSGGNTSTKETIKTFDALTITVAEAGEEEIFKATPGTEGTYKAITFWAKNTSGSDLAAGNYGVYFGGQKFLGGVEGGEAGAWTGKTVPATDGAWVIKIVDDTDDNIFEATKKFDYKAFYIVDGVESIVEGSTATWTVE